MSTLEEMNKKDRKKTLVTVMKEIDKICDLSDDDKPDLKGSEKESVAWITEAYQLLTPDDELSETTASVLVELGISPAPKGKKEKKEKDTKAKSDEKSPAKSEKKETKKSTKPKGPGVIATIATLIEGAGKKGITKDQILSKLETQFPDRAKDAMKSTISVQVPSRINKERFPVGKTKEGGYFKEKK